jgi:LPXTG-motif cell wall-anchored protein
MVFRRQRIAWVLVVAALGAPSAAWGQGAGDEQYQDPFAPETEQDEGASEATPAPAPAPAGGGDASAPAPSSAPDPAPEANAAHQLPYTGADGSLIIAAGAAMIAGGVALRLRLRAG